MMKEDLEDHGERVLIAHYGDLVKYVCKTFFNWNGEKDRYGRYLLQYVGTEIVREQSPDYWVDFLIDMFRFFGDSWDYILIPDARFPNEIKRLRDEGFHTTHIRVERPGFNNALTEEQRHHLSETALDDTEPDVRILNDGSLHDLELRVEQYIREELYGE